MIAVRFTPGQRSAIEQQATALGVSVSEVIRRAVAQVQQQASSSAA
jgi:hypothetical protein